MNTQPLPDDIRQSITAFVDNQMLSDQERIAVQDAIEQSEELALQHKLESGLVHMLHARRDTLRGAVPIDLERRIRLSLAKEAHTPTRSSFSSFLALLRRPAVAIPMLIASAAIIVLVSSIERPTVQQPMVASVAPLVDLQLQSYENFSAILRGELTVQHETSSKSDLQEWFADNGVTYAVQFPAIEAQLVGGVVSKHEQKRFAHLVYSVGNHIVYMFEVDESSIAERSVGLEPTIADNLDQRRWHWEERKDTGTLFMWKSNNVVCAAVSDLQTDELSALFALNEL